MVNPLERKMQMAKIIASCTTMKHIETCLSVVSKWHSTGYGRLELITLDLYELCLLKGKVIIAKELLKHPIFQTSKS